MVFVPPKSRHPYFEEVGNEGGRRGSGTSPGEVRLTPFGLVQNPFEGRGRGSSGLPCPDPNTPIVMGRSPLGGGGGVDVLMMFFVVLVEVDVEEWVVVRPFGVGFLHSPTWSRVVAGVGDGSRPTGLDQSSLNGTSLSSF